MAARKKRKIVCRYCGYHMDAARSRCPFCGTYVNPEPVKAEKYSLLRKYEDAPDTIYVTEAHRFPVWKTVRRVLAVLILLVLAGSAVYGGKYLYQKYIVKESSAETPAAGALTVISVNGVVERTAPSMTAEAAGTAENNMNLSVYEVTEAEGYTWYRVGEDTWIPDDGTWVSYVPEGENSDGN